MYINALPKALADHRILHYRSRGIFQVAIRADQSIICRILSLLVGYAEAMRGALSGTSVACW